MHLKQNVIIVHYILKWTDDIADRKFSYVSTKPVTTMHRCYSRQKILIRIYIMTQTSTVDHIQLFSHIIRITGQHYILYKKASPPFLFLQLFLSFVYIFFFLCKNQERYLQNYNIHYYYFFSIFFLVKWISMSDPPYAIYC